MRWLLQKPSSRSGYELKKWPHDARTPIRSDRTVFLNVAGDLFVCAFWICVLIYGGTVWRYNGIRLNVIPFDAEKLIEAGRYVSLFSKEACGRFSC